MLFLGYQVQHQEEPSSKIMNHLKHTWLLTYITLIKSKYIGNLSNHILKLEKKKEMEQFKI